MGAWLDRPVPAAVALHQVTAPSDNVLVDILVVAEDALLALVGWGGKGGENTINWVFLYNEDRREE